MDDEKIALIALNLVGGVGPRKITALVQRFGSAAAVLRQDACELSRTPGINGEEAREITAAGRGPRLERELDLIRKRKPDVVTWDEERYPHRLKTIYDPPPVLYVDGEFLPEDGLSVAVVGSRRASLYGLGTAEKLAGEMAERGVTIVSGLAAGIDAAAHRGALAAGGRTIAVLGSGLLHIYPRANEPLAKKISRQGAVISEFPLLFPPGRRNFPRRNRIISGLSRGIVVVEAAERSGALITADFALEQGREVFAVPGNAGTFTSRGTNGLIRQGAKLVENADDVLEELAAEPGNGRTPGEGKENVPEIPLEGESGEILSLIGKEAREFDSIIDDTGIAPGRVLGILTRLEMSGLIRQLPGKKFVKNTE